jgi:hypothetical protein
MKLTADQVEQVVHRMPIAISVRNGAVGNRVDLAAGDWRTRLDMAPGETRRVDVPVDWVTGGAVLAVRSETGFRPHDLDPANRDERFLGVRLEVPR